jgi:hypothetical protein
MSAYNLRIKGDYCVFEIHPREGLRFLKLHTAKDARKIPFRVMVQPLRKTRGSNRLYIVHCGKVTDLPGFIQSMKDQSTVTRPPPFHLP